MDFSELDILLKKAGPFDQTHKKSWLLKKEALLCQTPLEEKRVQDKILTWHTQPKNRSVLRLSSLNAPLLKKALLSLEALNWSLNFEEPLNSFIQLQSFLHPETPPLWRTEHPKEVQEQSAQTQDAAKATQDFLLWCTTEAPKLHPITQACEAAYGLIVLHPFQTKPYALAYFFSAAFLQKSGWPLPLCPAGVQGSKNKIQEALVQGLKNSFSFLMQPAADIPKTRRQQPLKKIGALAELTETSIPTLRYWMDQKLLKPSTTTATGYHLFCAEAELRVREIKALKENRYTLAEVKAYLEKSTNHDLKQKIRALKTVQK